MPYSGELPVYIPDMDLLTPEAKEALETGLARLNEGVVYWKKGTGNTGIVQHLPFKKIAEIPDVTGNAQLTSLAQSVQAAQSAAVAATMFSTVVIVGAIVVQTQYLSAKLDKIQETVDLIDVDIHSQNIIFYLEKVTQYFGQIESARSLLCEIDMIEEIKDMAPAMLVSLASARYQLISFIDNILQLASGSAISDRHCQLILDFVYMILDLLPKGIAIESKLAVRVGKYRVADVCLEEGRRQYEIGVDSYRAFLNGQYKKVVAGETDGKTEIIGQYRSRSGQLLESEENGLLLGIMKK